VIQRSEFELLDNSRTERERERERENDSDQIPSVGKSRYSEGSKADKTRLSVHNKAFGARAFEAPVVQRVQALGQ